MKSAFLDILKTVIGGAALLAIGFFFFSGTTDKAPQIAEAGAVQYISDRSGNRVSDAFERIEQVSDDTYLGTVQGKTYIIVYRDGVAETVSAGFDTVSVTDTGFVVVEDGATFAVDAEGDAAGTVPAGVVLDTYDDTVAEDFVEQAEAIIDAGGEMEEADMPAVDPADETLDPAAALDTEPAMSDSEVDGESAAVSDPEETTEPETDSSDNTATDAAAQ